MTGAFSSTAALPLLAELFEREESLDFLESFTSQIGALFYGLPLNRASLTLKKESWQVPLSSRRGGSSLCRRNDGMEGIKLEMREGQDLWLSYRQ